jgi:hypothetical protein
MEHRQHMLIVNCRSISGDVGSGHRYAKARKAHSDEA